MNGKTWIEVYSSDSYHGILFTKIIGAGWEKEEAGDRTLFKQNGEVVGYYDKNTEKWHVLKQLADAYEERVKNKFEYFIVEQLKEFEGQAITISLLKVIADKLEKALKDYENNARLG